MYHRREARVGFVVRVAMRRNSLSLQKKFSTRCRHLYISKSQGIVVTRLALGGITAAAPRSSRSARIASLSKALSARSALKSRSVRSGATPALSCVGPAAGRTARDCQRIDQRDDLGRQAAAGTTDGLILRPAFGAGAVLVHPDDGAIDDHVLEVRVVRQGLEDPIEHASLGPSAKALKDEFQLPKASGRSRQGAPTRTIQRTASTKRRLSAPERPASSTFPGRSGAIRSH